MPMKINKHPMGPNFFTHGLWSKPKLGMQHIHPEPPKILSYAFTTKIKYISRINISVKYKIVIN
jgi:hypothetical protein